MHSHCIFSNVHNRPNVLQHFLIFLLILAFFSNILESIQFSLKNLFLPIKLRKAISLFKLELSELKIQLSVVFNCCSNLHPNQNFIQIETIVRDLSLLVQNYEKQYTSKRCCKFLCVLMFRNTKKFLYQIISTFNHLNHLIIK